MWLFLSFGFFSIVKDRENEGHVLVRARMEKHLKSLCEKAKFDDVEIVSTPTADYPYRIYIDGGMFFDAILPLMQEYLADNFKNSIPKDEVAYHDACMDVWCDMRQLQAPRYVDRSDIGIFASDKPMSKKNRDAIISGRKR